MMWVGDWWAHWLWMVLFWVILIALIAWAVVRLAPNGRPRDPDDDEQRQRALDG